jgi:hypothetical protein
MMRTVLVLAAASALAWQVPATAAQPGPQAFLEKLYAHYPTPAGGDFDPWDKAAPAWLDLPLVALLRESARLGSPDEVGPLDYDAFCQCQDAGDLEVHIGAVRAVGPDRAEAKVSLAFPPPGKSRRITITLARVAGGWRVHDIAAADRPSLAAYLRAENARRRRR